MLNAERIWKELIQKMTIFEAYNSTKKKLEAAGIEDFVFEAKQIIKHITGLSAVQILSNYQKQLSEYQHNNLVAITRQREIRYPLQYILGQWDFYGRTYYVGPGVLIPRADTEILIDKCLEYLNDKEKPEILDLCAGSGCIGITLGLEKQNSDVLMVEKFEEAKRYAEKNIKFNNAENVKIIAGDIFDACSSDKKYDLIASNPPYIAESQINLMSVETKFEPETALIAEDDGYVFYKAIIKNYADSLKTGGMMIFEVGIGQADTVKQLLSEADFKDIGIVKDLNNIDRVVFGIKQ